MDAYSKSKVLAEKAAWDFVNGLPEDEKITLSVINPSVIYGPSLIKSDFASGEICCNLMNKGLPAIPKISFGLVDVRDVAQAHVNAIKSDEAQGKRFIVCNESIWFVDIGK